jgi:hypothetical protein
MQVSNTVSTLHFAYAIHVPHNAHPLLPYTALTDCFFVTEGCSMQYELNLEMFKLTSFKIKKDLKEIKDLHGK